MLINLFLIIKIELLFKNKQIIIKMEKNIIIKKFPKCYLRASSFTNCENFNSNNIVLIFNTHSLSHFIIELKNNDYFIIYTLLDNKKYYLIFKKSKFEIRGKFEELCYATLTEDENKAELFIKDDEDLLYWKMNDDENNKIPLTFYELYSYDTDGFFSITVLLCPSKILNDKSDILLI